MKTNGRGTLAVISCAVLVACGGATNGGSGAPANEGPADSGPPATGHDSGAADAGTPKPPPTGNDAAADAPAGPDHGMPSDTYPAFTPDFGQLVNNGGYVMKNPVIVAITWNSDPAQATFDAFADTIGPTSYWHATSSEYGVNAAVSGAANHVHVATAAPATVQDSDLQTLVTTNAGMAWPAATQDTIYAFFLPPGTSLNMGGMGDACAAGVGGYHDQVSAGAGVTAYAVVPSCTFGAGNTAEQQSTMSMSHELNEAVTDPQPSGMTPGWVGFDPDHFGFDWFQEFQSENGDACELFKSSFYEDIESSPAAFDYWVQRTWSNASGAAGHNPCVPVPTTPYFNVTPIGLAKVTITLPTQLTGGSSPMDVQTKGVHIPLNQTATIPLGFYSDGPTGGPWTLSYIEGSPLNPPPTPRLTVNIDKTSGQNGEKAYATVTVTTVGPLKGELIVFKSAMNGSTHYMPVVIGSE